MFIGFWSCADLEGAGGPDPPKSHKHIGFPSNTGPEPLKITKLPRLIGPPGKRFADRPDDGPLIVVFGASLPSRKK